MIKYNNDTIMQLDEKFFDNRKPEDYHSTETIQNLCERLVSNNEYFCVVSYEYSHQNREWSWKNLNDKDFLAIFGILSIENNWFQAYTMQWGDIYIVCKLDILSTYNDKNIILIYNSYEEYLKEITWLVPEPNVESHVHYSLMLDF